MRTCWQRISKIWSLSIKLYGAVFIQVRVTWHLTTNLLCKQSKKKFTDLRSQVFPNCVELCWLFLIFCLRRSFWGCPRECLSLSRSRSDWKNTKTLMQNSRTNIAMGQKTAKPFGKHRIHQMRARRKGSFGSLCWARMRVFGPDEQLLFRRIDDFQNNEN